VDHFDLCIVGAGVIGIAIAEAVARSKPPSYSILLLEKNTSFGQETSSRNSEVIHAGLYYPQGSLKARLCRRGSALLYDYCYKHNIAHRRIGKYIVAQEGELEALQALAERARGNGVVDLYWRDRKALQEKEPLVEGCAALFSANTGIVDSHGLMHSLLSQAQVAGVEYVCRTSVERVLCSGKGLEVHTVSGELGQVEEFQFHCSALINAAGLDAQILASRIDAVQSAHIPLLQLSKGNYFRLNGRAPFQHLIYPLPAPQTSGLGIHASIDLGGAVRFGPDVEAIEAVDYRVNVQRKVQFVAAIQRYYPSLDPAQLVPDYAGVRPKLYSASGQAMDFVIQTADVHGVPGLVQLFGIESPGLTASLAIGEAIAQHLA
jgi:L-2-hydroxyglutarate oxidase LhgO